MDAFVRDHAPSSQRAPEAAIGTSANGEQLNELRVRAQANMI